MKNRVPFFDMFSCLKSDEGYSSLLAATEVLSVTVKMEARTLRAEMMFPQPVPPVMLGKLEAEIALEMCLDKVSVIPVINHEKAVAKGKSRPDKKCGAVIMGKAIRGKSMPMSDVNLNSGRVIIEGQVFSVESREVKNGSAWIMSFDITDRTNSLRVSKFMSDAGSGQICGKIRPGMYLTVQGTVGFNRYDGDLAVDPVNIVEAKGKVRLDDAEEKRVELHLHTRFSAMDGLTDPESAIERAALWGHRAIAITDHGVAQAYPDAYTAARKKGVKVLYGTEAYFVNNLAAAAVSGEGDAPLDGEFAVFDIETTGLDPEREAITEIGAVIWSGGRILDRFQTFVNPHRPISPEITRLTGIRDSDVAGAPDEREAVSAFLEFAGDRPLCAHNAAFDVGFIAAACRRSDMAFRPFYADTLALTRALLPELRRHKLDVVAAHLSMPEFNHHRASDDAETAAGILGRMLERLSELGASRLSDVNALLRGMGDGGFDWRSIKHLSILVKNKTGLKNLYRLISDAHIKHFKKFPVILASELVRYREGLIIGSACERGEVMDAVISRRSREEIKRYASFCDYLEIMPVSNNAFLLDRNKVRNLDEIRGFNRTVAEIGEELGIPVCATGDVHFL